MHKKAGKKNNADKTKTFLSVALPSESPGGAFLFLQAINLLLRVQCRLARGDFCRYV